jgi:hypothetical protein
MKNKKNKNPARLKKCKNIPKLTKRKNKPNAKKNGQGLEFTK